VDDGTPVSERGPRGDAWRDARVGALCSFEAQGQNRLNPAGAMSRHHAASAGDDCQQRDRRDRNPRIAGLDAEELAGHVPPQCQGRRCAGSQPQQATRRGKGQGNGVDRASNDADVSIAPSITPYGGFSPVRRRLTDREARIDLTFGIDDAHRPRLG
jgi:hypothetical protein